MLSNDEPWQPAEPSEGWFRTLFDHSNDAIFVLDPPADRIAAANPRARELLGYTEEELQGLRISQVHPQGLPELLRFMDQVVADRGGWTDAFSCMTKDGREVPAEVSAAPVELQGRRYVVAHVRDLADRAWLDRTLEGLLEVTAAVTGDAFLRTVVRELARALGVRWAFVTRCSAGERPRIVAQWDARRASAVEPRGEPAPCSLGFGGGDALLVPAGARERLATDPFVAAHDVESYVGHAMRARGGEVLGHLVACDDRPLTAAAPRAATVVRLFAARAAVELERAGAEAELRRTRDRLAGILAAASDAIVTVDAGGRVELFNASSERLFERSAAEVMGTAAAPLFEEELTALIARSTSAHVVTRARRAQGTKVRVQVAAAASEDQGRHLTTLFVRDLTDRDRAEQLGRTVGYLQDELQKEVGADDVVGESPAFKSAVERALLVAPTDSAVLLTGETGTGKEVLARLIHRMSRRSQAPLIKVNCAALPAALVESELFGHERGAFTGATAARAGRFELADGGTIFLDEVGDMPLEIQAKLLRVLQEHEFERIGGTRTLRVDARVIAATNRDLEPMVKAGTFRGDLYYRLNVFGIRSPALRERREDVPVLARHFMKRFAGRMGRTVQQIQPETLARLLEYDWPGNVRELSNVIERSVILSPGENLLLAESLDARPQPLGSPRVPERVVEQAPEPRSLDEVLEAVERDHISAALSAANGIIEGPRGAARRLGVHPNTLRTRMKRLGVQRLTE